MAEALLAADLARDDEFLRSTTDWPLTTERFAGLAHDTFTDVRHTINASIQSDSGDRVRAWTGSVTAASEEDSSEQKDTDQGWRRAHIALQFCVPSIGEDGHPPSVCRLCIRTQLRALRWFSQAWAGGTCHPTEPTSHRSPQAMSKCCRLRKPARNALFGFAV
jgi:hypothetical protein